MTETITIGEQEFEIEVRPITLIVPSANMGPPIKYKRVRLDSEVTTYHATRVKKLHQEFTTAWKLFHSKTSTQTEPSANPETIRQSGSGAVHLMGLIDLTLKFSDQGIPVVWVYPESFLHPGWQVALGDLAIWFSRRPS